MEQLTLIYISTIDFYSAFSARFGETKVDKQSLINRRSSKLTTLNNIYAVKSPSGEIMHEYRNSSLLNLYLTKFELHESSTHHSLLAGNVFTTGCFEMLLWVY